MPQSSPPLPAENPLPAMPSMDMPEDDSSLPKGEKNRLCIATRKVRPIGALLRFVCGPDGALVPDLRGKLPGRGVWVSGDRASLALALKRKAFSRALKQEVTIPQDLAGMVETLMAREALQALSLANKAGALVMGFAKIEAAKGTMRALVQARDGSAAEINRLRGLCRNRGREGNAPEWIQLFDAVQLGLSLGHEHVIHAALMDKDVGSVFMDRAHRLAIFQAGDPAEHLSVPNSGSSGHSGLQKG